MSPAAARSGAKAIIVDENFAPKEEVTPKNAARPREASLNSLRSKYNDRLFKNLEKKLNARMLV